MTTHRLRIGNWNLKISNLPDEEVKYPTVDKDCKELEYVPGKVERGYYIDPETKQIVPKVYKNINGKPVDKLKRTEATDKYKEVDAKEAIDLKAKQFLFVEDVPNDLMTLLQNNKAIKIIYSAGNGYSSYFGYIYLHQNGKIIMSLGTQFISEQVSDIEQGRANKRKVEVTLQNTDGIARAQADELLTL